MLRISCVAAQLAASQEGLSSISKEVSTFSLVHILLQPVVELLFNIFLSIKQYFQQAEFAVYVEMFRHMCAIFRSGV
jgi:hypothetical protein